MQQWKTEEKRCLGHDHFMKNHDGKKEKVCFVELRVENREE